MIDDFRPSIKIQEEDGSPTGRPRTLKVTNAALTDNGDGTFSLACLTPSAADLIYLKLDQTTPQTTVGTFKFPKLTVVSTTLPTSTDAYVLGLLMSSYEQQTSPFTDSAVTGTASRMFYYPAKFAFRAGLTGWLPANNESYGAGAWSDANIGQGSVAFGWGNRAKGNWSFLAGYNNIGDGSGSVILGNTNNNAAAASNNFIVGGSNTVYQGSSNTLIGGTNTFYNGVANFNTVMGEGNTIGVVGTSIEVNTVFGKSNIVSGYYNFAAGEIHNVLGRYNAAIGKQHVINNDCYYVFASGLHHVITGPVVATVMGMSNTVTCTGQVVSIGTYQTITAANCYVIGANSTASAENVYLFGLGNSSTGGNFAGLGSGLSNTGTTGASMGASNAHYADYDFTFGWNNIARGSSNYLFGNGVTGIGNEVIAIGQDFYPTAGIQFGRNEQMLSLQYVGTTGSISQASVGVASPIPTQPFEVGGSINRLGSISRTLNVGGGSLVAGTVIIRVHSYKTIRGKRYYSPDYKESGSIEVGNTDSISFTWYETADVEGYYVTVSDTGSGYAYDVGWDNGLTGGVDGSAGYSDPASATALPTGFTDTFNPYLWVDMYGNTWAEGGVNTLTGPTTYMQNIYDHTTGTLLTNSQYLSCAILAYKDFGDGKGRVYSSVGVADCTMWALFPEDTYSTTAVATQDDNATYDLTANGDTFTFRVYPYRTIGGTKYISKYDSWVYNEPYVTPYQITLDSSTNQCRILLSWDVCNDQIDSTPADGYFVLFTDPQNGYADDWYVDIATNSLTYNGSATVGLINGDMLSTYNDYLGYYTITWDAATFQGQPVDGYLMYVERDEQNGYYNDGTNDHYVDMGNVLTYDYNGASTVGLIAGIADVAIQTTKQGVVDFTVRGNIDTVGLNAVSYNDEPVFDEDEMVFA